MTEPVANQDDSQFAPPAPSLESVLSAPALGPVVDEEPRICQHCGTVLKPHGGVNLGFFHCNTCGCCFDAEGEQRPDHPLCSIAIEANRQRLMDQAAAQSGGTPRGRGR